MVRNTQTYCQLDTGNSKYNQLSKVQRSLDKKRLFFIIGNNKINLQIDFINKIKYILASLEDSTLYYKYFLIGYYRIRINSRVLLS